MRRAAVGLGIDRHCREPETARSPDDTAGDFAAIGDQYAFEHSADLPCAACRLCGEDGEMSMDANAFRRGNAVARRDWNSPSTSALTPPSTPYGDFSASYNPGYESYDARGRWRWLASLAIQARMTSSISGESRVFSQSARSAS